MAYVDRMRTAVVVFAVLGSASASADQPFAPSAPQAVLQLPTDVQRSPATQPTLSFVLPRLPNLDLGDRGWRLAFSTIVGAAGGIIISSASFHMTCPELARDFRASNPTCKAPALIGTAVLAPPIATMAAFAAGWFLHGNGSLVSSVIGGGVGSAIGLTLWAIPMSTSDRVMMLPLFAALGASIGFEFTSDTRRDEPQVSVAFSGNGLTVVGAF